MQSSGRKFGSSDNYVGNFLNNSLSCWLGEYYHCVNISRLSQIIYIFLGERWGSSPQISYILTIVVSLLHCTKYQLEERELQFFLFFFKQKNYLTGFILLKNNKTANFNVFLKSETSCWILPLSLSLLVVVFSFHQQIYDGGSVLSRWRSKVSPASV